MAKEIHEQPEVISHTLANYIDFADGQRDACPSSASIPPASRRSPSRPAAPPTTPASSASTGSSAMRAFPSRSTSPPSSATASRRCPRAAWRSSSRSRARPPTRWRRCATASRRASASPRSSTCAPPPSPANPTSCCRRSPGPRSASPRPRPSPASSRCWPAWRSRSAARAAPSTRRRRSELAQALAEVPRHIVDAAAQRGRATRSSPTTSSKARDVLYLGRGISYPARARRRAEAQGDLLHPRRGLCRRRAEARPHRADRRERAGDRRGARATSCSRRPCPTCRRWRRAAARIILISDAGAERGRLRARGAYRRARRRIRFANPLLYAVPVQLLAYHTAVFMGTDVDQPRNLAKSVTVE